jgi:hypothetical protein
LTTWKKGVYLLKSGAKWGKVGKSEASDVSFIQSKDSSHIKIVFSPDSKKKFED